MGKSLIPTGPAPKKRKRKRSWPRIRMASGLEMLSELSVILRMADDIDAAAGSATADIDKKENKDLDKKEETPPASTTSLMTISTDVGILIFLCLCPRLLSRLKRVSTRFQYWVERSFSVERDVVILRAIKPRIMPLLALCPRVRTFVNEQKRDWFEMEDFDVLMAIDRAYRHNFPINPMMLAKILDKESKLQPKYSNFPMLSNLRTMRLQFVRPTGLPNLKPLRNLRHLQLVGWWSTAGTGGTGPGPGTGLGMAPLADCHHLDSLIIQDIPLVSSFRVLESLQKLSYLCVDGVSSHTTEGDVEKFLGWLPESLRALRIFVGSNNRDTTRTRSEHCANAYTRAVLRLRKLQILECEPIPGRAHAGQDENIKGIWRRFWEAILPRLSRSNFIFHHGVVCSSPHALPNMRVACIFADTELDFGMLSKTLPSLEQLQLRIVCSDGKQLNVHQGSMTSVRALSLNFVTGTKTMYMVPHKTVKKIVGCFPSIVDLSLRSRKSAYRFTPTLPESLQYLTISCASFTRLVATLRRFKLHKRWWRLNVLNVISELSQKREAYTPKVDVALREFADKVFVHWVGGKRLTPGLMLPSTDSTLLTRTGVVVHPSLTPSDLLMLWQRVE